MTKRQVMLYAIRTHKKVLMRHVKDKKKIKPGLIYFRNNLEQLFEEQPIVLERWTKEMNDELNNKKTS